ncbi:hypothetical protein PIROE2DRAFT_21389 [Piromyces sp. E2]|nr:hypothetical protein PIROE2DRAFT_21389 [Piromyces sp. E2]|eukprot:OUM58237.1 hypothetical protein PIROE2DRAFT_21389 [Piromyces sp. E2]
MTITDFEAFENVLFSQLRTDDKECLKNIVKEKKLIETYLNGKDLTNVKKFVNDFNDVILGSDIKKYKLFEAVLNRELFTAVLAEFRESNVLIRACKEVNRKAVEWLLTMNINYGIQDEQGMTALMHAAEHASLDFAVEKIMKSDGKCIQLVDNNGNNVLFHATSSPDILKKLLKSKNNLDIHHLNHDNENLLLYCSRYNKMRSFEILNKHNSFDPNLCNCVGKTTAMYLVENGRFSEVKAFVKDNKINPNYINKLGDSLVSVYIKKYYQHYIGNIGETNFASNYNYVVIKNYALTLRSLIDLKCDFNIPVDKEGNTLIMVLSMMGDQVTSRYLLEKCNIDLLKENYKGQNAKNCSGNNSYPVVEEYAKQAQNWVLEVFYPNEVKDISLCSNTFRKDNPTSFGNLMQRYNNAGLA